MRSFGHIGEDRVLSMAKQTFAGVTHDVLLRYSMGLESYVGFNCSRISHQQH